MIALQPLAADQAGTVAHLRLPETQVDFVGDIAEMANDPDPNVQMHIGTVQNEVVGFFKIDFDFRQKVPLLPDNAMGLRGLLVGGQYQGRGYGHALLSKLPHYLSQTYPGAAEIWLSVDVANHVAVRCYESTGWQKSGALRDGRCGEEHVMRLVLAGTP